MQPAWIAIVAAALALACTPNDTVYHDYGPGAAFGGGSPGAPCQDGDVNEYGSCLDYGKDGYYRCEHSLECKPAYVCRHFDSLACTCNPKPGVWEQCAPQCSSHDDCNRATDGEVLDWGFICDSKRGVCRTPPSCLTNADCEAPSICADGDWRHWYVAGDGSLSEMIGPRRCTSRGELPEGAECQWGADCATGSCAGMRSIGRCESPCQRNDECGDGYLCVQSEWGAPYCSDDVSTCQGPGRPEQLCHRGQWVQGCSDDHPCAQGDCRLPDADPEVSGYGGLGFGVGHCADERLCAPGQFRSEWTDAWIAPTCFSTRSCWDDTDCLAPEVCRQLDATASTRRCGIEVARP